MKSVDEHDVTREITRLANQIVTEQELQLKVDGCRVPASLREDDDIRRFVLFLAVKLAEVLVDRSLGPGAGKPEYICSKARSITGRLQSLIRKRERHLKDLESRGHA